MSRYILLVGLLCCCTPTAQAGLYYSQEKYAELPAEWRGLLADLRLLRSIALPATPTTPPSTLKLQYEEALKRLHEKAAAGPLTPIEAADLGALLIRLGRTSEAVGWLRQAQAEFPRQFEIAANLATAWQMEGELRRAAEQLRLAVSLASSEQREAEELHLQWVELRLAEPPDRQPLDDLFGFARERPLPPKALAHTQRLMLWFPSEGRLLWLLGEIAGRYGDLAEAAELLEVAVGEFGLSDPELRRRRAELRKAWMDELNKPLAGVSAQKSEHAGHAGSSISFKSRRPLIQQRFNLKSLPAISKTGLNSLPWGLLMETTLDRHYRPGFPTPLKELSGLKVELVGFMQPLGDDLETSLFLLVEYPIGCWYCELPAPTGIVCVELREGKTIELTRNPLKVTGILRLNPDDPEDFFFTVTEAEIGVVD